MKPNQDQHFDRTVVGYDLRRPESLAAVHMTSYDEKARYETIYDICESQLSGLNLFTVDPTQIHSFRLPEGARVIAFDLPTPYVEATARGNVSVPPMLPWFEEPDNWTFLGFDVVDPRTQMSAVNSYLAECGFCHNAVENSIRVNEFGLIDSIEVAESASSKFEKKYFEHAPWIPCGVWLHKLIH